MSVTLDKTPRLYAVTLWSGGTREVVALDAPSAARAAFADRWTEVDANGRGHHVGPAGDGTWYITYSACEGSCPVAVVRPLDARPVHAVRPTGATECGATVTDRATELSARGRDVTCEACRAAWSPATRAAVDTLA